MSATQHTPGPWKAQRLSPAAKTWRLLDSQSQIALFSFENLPKVQDESNARLIAAAPDMLAFAERVASWQGNEEGMSGCVWSELIRQASEVIARATGAEGEGSK